MIKRFYSCHKIQMTNQTVFEPMYQQFKQLPVANIVGECADGAQCPYCGKNMQFVTRMGFDILSCGNCKYELYYEYRKVFATISSVYHSYKRYLYRVTVNNSNVYVNKLQHGYTTLSELLNQAVVQSLQNKIIK